MSHQRQRHIDLHELARRVMLERGLVPDIPQGVMDQVDRLTGPARETTSDVKDLRHLDWCSIDNDDSRDLDQLSVAEDLGNETVRVLVAIADVDAMVKKGSPVDLHAHANTTSVYTAGGIFPMLPERLSTDLTSLNPAEDRMAVVISYVVHAEGEVGSPEIYRALVHNKAKLAYSAVGDWLDGTGDMPQAMAAAKGVADQVRLQDSVAQRLRERRQEEGALTLETIEPKAEVTDGQVVDLHVEEKNRAHELIENLMIASNGVTARYLVEKRFPTVRRVVRTPERWERIREIAEEVKESLPREPDSRALDVFLRKRKKADPLRFPDLSLAVVKMLGSGEYVVNMPGREPIGHFGLAVRDYSHSTAPNRRYPDVITQRLLKAAIAGQPVPYSEDELWDLAQHCTDQEDGAKKVERHLRKSAAAALLADRIGEKFDGLVTGATSRGTWVRVFSPPAEGMLTNPGGGLDVGHRLQVRLESVDIERGFIDFVRVRG